MGPQRLLRPGTPAEVSVLAGMALDPGHGMPRSGGFPVAEDAPRGVMVGLGLVGVTVGPDAGPRRTEGLAGLPAHHGRALHDAHRRHGRGGGHRARSDAERPRLHLDGGLRRVLLPAARGAATRGAHDRRARVEPAAGARANGRVGLGHHLHDGLGGGLHPHQAQRAPPGPGAHRQPHRPAQPHRLRRCGRATARDVPTPRRAGRARGHRPRRLQARQRPRRPRCRRPPARRARQGLDRIAAAGRPAGTVRRRRVRPDARGGGGG